MSWKWTGTLAFATLTMLLGCKNEPAPVPVGVKGNAHYEGGKPVSEMILTFHPQDESNKNTRPTQVTDKQGNFSLTCVKGRYKVTLAGVPKGGAGGAGGGPGGYVPAPQPQDLGNNIYRDPERTPWLVEVPETGKDNVVLIVKTP